MNKYSIGITTFSGRFSSIKELIEQIRKYSLCDILIAVNGDYKQKFNEEYRQKILGLCASHEGIYPIFFPEVRGTSKLWNSLIIHNPKEYCIILNDDVKIVSQVFFEDINKLVFDDTPLVTTINDSFSHFIINKKGAYDIGYFDERFLGFGDEDGDMIYRYIVKYNKNLPNILVHGIEHLNSSVRDNNIRPSNKWSMFNKEFLHQKYKSNPNAIYRLSGHLMDKILPDENQYPYEYFYMENKYKL